MRDSLTQFRSNMAAGTISHTTRAADYFVAPRERQWLQTFYLDAQYLLGDNQKNVLAAQVHQWSYTSSDMSFWAKLGWDNGEQLPSCSPSPTPCVRLTAAPHQRRCVLFVHMVCP